MSPYSFFIISAALLLPPLAEAEEVVFQRQEEHYEGAVDGVLKGSAEVLKDQSFWGEENLFVAGVAGGGISQTALLRFGDLFGHEPGQVPRTAKIREAQLHLYKTGEPADEGQYGEESEFNRRIRLYRMLTPFHAGPPDTENASASTFSYRSALAEEPEYWGKNHELENGPQPGTDYDPETIGGIPLEPGVVDHWYTIDVTEIATAWQGGTANEGFYLTARGYWIGAIFASCNHPDPELRPKLIIRYEN